MIGQTNLIITPQCPQPTSHECNIYQHMHATYISNDFVCNKIRENISGCPYAFHFDKN